MEPKWSPEANFSYFCETMILDDPTMVLHGFYGLRGQEIDKKAIQKATLEQSCKKVTFLGKICENSAFWDSFFTGGRCRKIILF